ncbi:T9SS type B sorting domain-containing protein [Flavobacterium sp.]|uniref:T9SS type B sorting domain-containing protein n=1 Tax=Flavobacterium sp. TaxID=239 RepID=UPI004047BAAC
MKKLAILLTLLFSCLLSFAQLSNKHWLPPLHARVGGVVNEHYIYLSTPFLDPFEVTITTGDGTPISGSPFSISLINPIKVLIGNSQPSSMFVDINNVNTIESDKGLILSGPKDFYVSLRVRSTNHAETLVSKGKTAKGNNFRLGSMPQEFDGESRNFVSSFMATEDNTTVTVSDYDPGVEFVSGNGNITLNSQTFLLNTGQSVVLSGYNEVPANLSGFVGALLNSDKPIVVNTGNALSGFGTAFEGQDFNLDQIVSFNQVGNQYILVKGNGSDTSERPLVIATQDNTTIFLNGNTVPVATLNAGEHFLIPSNNYIGTFQHKNMYIESNNPIYVYQFLAGNSSDATTGLNFIPPLSCYWQKTVKLIPEFKRIGNTSYDDSQIIIVTAADATVSINNTTVTSASLIPLGNSNWKTYRVPSNLTNIVVESTGPVAVGVFGSDGENAGFGGYYSGFGSEPEDTDITICSNSTIDLFEAIEGNPEAGGFWTPSLTSGTNIFDATLDNEGTYIYNYDIVCDGLTVNETISINITFEQLPFAGNDTTKTFCASESPFDLFTLLGTTDNSGNWTLNGVPRTDGFIDPSIDPAGNYIYTIPATSACEAVSATVSVDIYTSLQLANTITDIETCDDAIDGDTSGESLFTLTDRDNQITDNAAGLTVKYYENQTDAENNATNNITSIRAITGKTIYFRLENPDGCFVVDSFNLIVNPLPIIDNIVTLSQCDTDNDAITDFNLTQANSIISSDANLIFSYHLTQLGAQNNTNTITNTTNFTAPNGTVVWSRVETIKGCLRTARVNLAVSTTTLPNTTNFDLYGCDNYISDANPENDGFHLFNFNDTTPSLNAIEYFKNLFPISQRPNLVVTFYENEADALAEENRITNINNYRNLIQDTQLVWVRIDSNLNNACFGLGEYLTLHVVPVPEINLGVDFTLCVDPITGLGSQVVDATATGGSGNYTYTWTPTNPSTDSSGNENSLFTITQAGSYLVIVRDNTTNCENSDTINVFFSSEPAQFEADIVNPTFSSGLSTIQAIASGGFGSYEYSLDQIEWQISPIFTSITNGSYTVYVRDIQGCGILSSRSLYAITYPNFFTPNGDGYNETWNISNLPISFEPKIYIFDRYGKLIKQIDPYGQGWNGRFNGQELPSTDYWFILEYKENGTPKEFKSHFSLKR